MKKLPIIHVIALILLIQGCASVRLNTREVDALRLNPDVIPEHYHVSLWADPKQESFSGQVSIDLKLVREQPYLMIHGQDLEIQSLRLHSQDLERPGSFELINQAGLAKLDFKGLITAGRHRLEINYRGRYQEDLMGLYRVKEGEDAYLYTQFEPLSARKMLPCFDEPGFKSPFSLKVITNPGHTVIANAPLDRSYSEGEQQVHIFKATQPISSYLLALAIGPFDVVQGHIASNAERAHDLPFRAIATNGKGAKLALAVKETPRIVERLENYFALAYPFDKLDIIAIPDFRAGAMENVGAITFREWYLLMGDEQASVDQKRGFYLVMAHELAHQWFGNLVTMPWWDDLWLNEAFATWISHKIIGELKPELKLEERLLSNAYEAMSQDSLSAARRIREEIKSSHDIHNAFDSITYSKGGAVLSMLENYLSPELFQQAVSEHLKRFSFGSATSKDFLQSLAVYADKKLVKSADSFLNQSGLPSVELSYGCTDQGFKVALSAKRYAPLGSQLDTKRSWPIPLCLGYESKTGLKKHCLIMDSSTKFATIKSDHCPAFVNPNYHGQGYYRFSLNMADWQTLLTAPSSIVSESDRLAMADSLMGELYAGNLDFAFVAESLRSLSSINSSMLTKYFIDLIKEAANFWTSNDNYDVVMAYGQRYLVEIYDQLSALKSLSTDQQNLRRDVVSYLAEAQHPLALMELTLIAKSYLDHDLSGSPSAMAVDENIISTALGVALQQEDDRYLERVIALLDQEKDTAKRAYLLSGLALAREGGDADIIRNLVFSPSLRKNERLRLLYEHLSRPSNQPYTWKFLTANFSQFEKILTPSQMANLPYLAGGLCDEQSSLELSNFFASRINQYEGGPRNLAESTELIDLCSARKKKLSPLAENFFSGLKDTSVASENY